MPISELDWNEDEKKCVQDDDETITTMPWKMPTNMVPEVIDKQLAAFGLEVVQYDIGEEGEVM